MELKATVQRVQYRHVLGNRGKPCGPLLIFGGITREFASTACDAQSPSALTSQQTLVDA